MACLRALLQRAFAKRHTEDTVWAAKRFAPLTAVPSAESTGFELPDALTELFPGSGGGARMAGAKIQRGEYRSHRFAHVALVAGPPPDNNYIDPVVQWAHRGAVFLFALGSFKVQGLARIAQADASFLTRLNQQTALAEAVGGRLQRREVAQGLKSAPGPLLEKALFLGARERVAVRLIAARRPETVVNERRRKARHAARKRGSTPSPTPLPRLAGSLFLTPGPGTGWTPVTVGKAYPLRWQVELVFTSGKSELQLSTLPTKNEGPPLWDLSGRLRRRRLTYALCPSLRAARWADTRRELSLLNLMRHLQAVADRWRQALFASPAPLRPVLSQIWIRAERLASKAARQRRPSAQRLRESLPTQNDFIALTIKLAA